MTSLLHALPLPNSLRTKIGAAWSRLRTWLSPVRRFGSRVRFALRRKRFCAAPPVEGCDVVVVSSGGVATTALMEHISRFARINSPNDQDMLKHLPYPPRGLPREGLKFLFIYGDCGEVYWSLRRRGWVAAQSLKLGAVLAHVLPHPLCIPFFKHAVRAQSKRWHRFKKRQPDNQVLILEYSQIWSRRQEIAAFCEISDPAFLSSFPEWKRRTGQAGNSA